MLALYRTRCSALRAMALAILAFLAVGGEARAETVVESWRSPFGAPRSVSVNWTDGSCWAATGGNVIHIAGNGDIVGQARGLNRPNAVCVNPSDGSCWVADIGANEIVHLSVDGQVLWRQQYPIAVSLSVNPRDGSCWACVGDGVLHLAPDGSELSRISGFYFTYRELDTNAISANPVDGSCWVADWEHGRVVHLAADGSLLWEGGSFVSPLSVCVDAKDGSCWVGDEGWEPSLAVRHSALVHLSPEGEELFRSTTVNFPASVSVNATDGSCWVADTFNSQVVCVSPSGTEMWRGGGFLDPSGVSVNPVDGSCWVADVGDITVVHLSAGGAELWRGKGYAYPRSVAVVPDDGACWVGGDGFVALVRPGATAGEVWRRETGPVTGVAVNAHDGSGWVALDRFIVTHLGEDGHELWAGSDFFQPRSISVNPSDGSVWVADGSADRVVHLAEDGSEVWHGDYPYPACVCANPIDGSCWVGTGDAVVHLAPDGSELVRVSGLYWPDYAAYPNALSVNPNDSSVWVVGWGNAIRHLAADGTELFRGTQFPAQSGVAVNFSDNSLWVAAEQVVHLSERGEEYWRGDGFYYPSSVATDPRDGSCWVADLNNSQLVHLVIVPSFSDVEYSCWAFHAVEACTEATVVSGYPDGTYRPWHAVTRDQMAVYISRALAGGDGNVPSGPAQATFPDVPVDHWAYRYVEYTAANGIVEGYPDGSYQPGVELDRDQMAAFIARAIAGGDDKVPAGPAIATFPDVATDFWAYKHIEFIKSQAVAQGYPDGKYHPEYVCARDQMAVFVARAFQLPL